MSSVTNNSNGLAALVSPLNEQQINQLQQTVSQMSPSQLAWVSGYFWGLSQSLASSVPSLLEPEVTSGQLTIIYGSQTGNAKGVAEYLAEQAKADNLSVRLFDAADYKPKELSKESHVIIISSTNGEGDAPDNARDFLEYLQSKKAPKLDGVKYAVLGLGDSSYEFFCQTGKDFDATLLALGASPILARGDCDVDYDSVAKQWINDVLSEVKVSLDSVSTNTGNAVFSAQVTPSSSVYNKQNPFAATLLTNQKITGRDSGKDVRHIEIDLDASGLTYQPGDALGVWYENSPELAQQILTLTGLTGNEEIEVDGKHYSLLDALIKHYEITASNPQFISHLAELTQSQTLVALTEDNDALRQFSAKHQIVDVLRSVAATLSPQQLIGSLRRLTPRLYSIASSQTEVDQEVHITVGVVEYLQDGEERLGGASGFLAKRLEEGDTVNVFIESNNHFKLPQDANAPVIMIGPGTGIAPFRGFIQERDNQGAKGKNWLFFGDRTFTQDFLYQVEWQKYLKSGVLTRMDVAFSRDQQDKVYVQHRILEQASDLWQWLQDGAYLYVCGDANRMAKDVHQALVMVVQQQGNMTSEQAEAFLNELRKEKRYQKDVY